MFLIVSFFQLNWKLSAGPIHVSLQGLVVRLWFHWQSKMHGQSDIPWRGKEHIITSQTHFFVFILSREAGCMCCLDGNRMNMCVYVCRNLWFAKHAKMNGSHQVGLFLFVFFMQVLIPLKDGIAVVTITSQAINMRERYPGMRTKRCCEEATESSCLACCPSAQASATRGKWMYSKNHHRFANNLLHSFSYLSWVAMFSSKLRWDCSIPERLYIEVRITLRIGATNVACLHLEPCRHACLEAILLL